MSILTSHWPQYIAEIREFTIEGEGQGALGSVPKVLPQKGIASPKRGI